MKKEEEEEESLTKRTYPHWVLPSGHSPPAGPGNILTPRRLDHQGRLGVPCFLYSCNSYYYPSISLSFAKIPDLLHLAPRYCEWVKWRRRLREGLVAVGTGLAARPPLRSVRAALPHTALALDVDAQSLVGVRVHPDPCVLPDVSSPTRFASQARLWVR